MDPALSLRLDRIRARLELLARCDTQLEVFGAATHEYQLEPALSEDEVAAFEHDHGVELPADYRLFITQLGNGGAGPFYGVAPLRAETPSYAAVDEATPPSLARPFGLIDAWQQGGEPGKPPIATGTSLYDGVIELSSHGCGYFDMLVIAGPSRGQVWADFTQAFAGVVPWYPSFFAGYEAWLDRALVEWACAALPALPDAEDEPIAEALAIVGPLLERAVDPEQAPDDPALHEYPHDATRLVAGLAYLRLLQGRSDDALALFDELAARSNADGDARRQLGRARVLAHDGVLERALDATRAGLESPGLWYATELELRREQRGLLLDLGRVDEALEVSRTLAEMESSDLFAQYDLAWALIELERVDEAAALLIAAAEREVGCDPEAPLAERIEQTAAGLLDALEREDMHEHAAKLRERLRA